jgi:hypothetical protein
MAPNTDSPTEDSCQYTINRVSTALHYGKHPITSLTVQSVLILVYSKPVELGLLTERRPGCGQETARNDDQGEIASPQRLAMTRLPTSFEYTLLICDRNLEFVSQYGIIVEAMSFYKARLCEQFRLPIGRPTKFATALARFRGRYDYNHRTSRQGRHGQDDRGGVAG